MTWRKGPRPWTVRLFALALLIAALIGLFEALLAHEALLVGRWFDRLPMIRWTPDLAIVATFSQFTIALIPLVWIYAFASKAARWVVLAFGAIKIGYAAINTGDAILLKSPQVVWLEKALVLIALMMLFVPATTRWLGKDEEASLASFD
ncbi:hypothetical protein [Qipengyuania nanhaisediminis]|uniref:hypothetical protein n=1 Tax=Qipengyuania nanhaisediminis TaxID=604088 RepID=UPI0038B3A82B